MSGKPPQKVSFMTQTITGLEPKAAKFLITFASQGQRIFTIEQAQAFWGDAAYTANVLSRLEQGGWLHRLERGTYMIIPMEADPERRWSESAMVIAPFLIEPAAVAYWSALNYWQLTEQIPHTVFVQSTARKSQREKEILGMTFRFVTVVEAKFFGVIRRTLDGQPIHVTDLEKTLVDAADRPDLSGGGIQLAQAVRTAHADVDWQKLDRYVQRWPTTSPLKRLGYLIDQMDLPIPNRKALLNRWQRALAPGIVQLEPGYGSGKGSIVTRWQLRINVTMP
jgi:predicted transcriptional regulator of viral defense system